MYWKFQAKRKFLNQYPIHHYTTVQWLKWPEEKLIKGQQVMRN